MHVFGCIPQDMMPLQNIYTQALDHDLKSSTSAKQTAELIQQRCYQVLHPSEQCLQQMQEIWNIICNFMGHLSHRLSRPRGMKSTSGDGNSRSSGQKSRRGWSVHTAEFDDVCVFVEISFSSNVTDNVMCVRMMLCLRWREQDSNTCSAVRSWRRPKPWRPKLKRTRGVTRPWTRGGSPEMTPKLR